MKSLRTSVSKDATRFVLMGISVRKRKGRIVAAATDGRRLVAIDITEYNKEVAAGDAKVDFITPLLPPSIKFPAADVAVEVLEDGDLVYETTLGHLRIKPVKGPFPQYEKVISVRSVVEGRGAYNPRYMKDLAEAADSYAPDAAMEIHRCRTNRDPQTTGDCGEMSVILIPQKPEWIAVIMDMRVDGAAEGKRKMERVAPEWVRDVWARGVEA